MSSLAQPSDASPPFDRIGTPLTSEQSARLAAEAALSRKAQDVVILKLAGIATFADYFVICSGTSDTHVEGISNAISDKMKEANQKVWHREGARKAPWVLLDYVDVVVHVFQRQAREFYGLERLWREAERTAVSDEGIAVDPAWANFDVDAGSKPERIWDDDKDEWDDDDDWDEEAKLSDEDEE